MRYFAAETPALVQMARAVVPDDPETAWRLLAVTAPAAGQQAQTWLAASDYVRSVLTSGPQSRAIAAAHLDLAAAGLLHDRPAGAAYTEALERAQATFVADESHAAALSCAIVRGRSCGTPDSAAPPRSRCAGRTRTSARTPRPCCERTSRWPGAGCDAYDLLQEALEAHRVAARHFEGTCDWTNQANTLVELAHRCAGSRAR